VRSKHLGGEGTLDGDQPGWSYVPVLVDRTGGVHWLAQPDPESLFRPQQEARRVADTLGLPMVEADYRRHVAVVEVAGEPTIQLRPYDQDVPRSRPGPVAIFALLAMLMVVLGGGL
jgi:hypothetical protein